MRQLITPDEARMVAMLVASAGIIAAMLLRRRREPKPVAVEQTATGDHDLAIRQRLAAAGYNIPTSTSVQIVHFEDDLFDGLANGFSQCFADVRGKRCRVIDFAPGQALQVMTHRANQRFVVGGGFIKVYKWDSLGAARGGADATSDGWLGPGAQLQLPAGTPHAMFANLETGAAIHEVGRDSDAKHVHVVTTHRSIIDHRSTVPGRNILGPEATLRFIPADHFAAFAGKVVVITGCSRGLGLGLCQHLAAAGASVVATCREPASAAALHTALKHSGRSIVLPCDVADGSSIAALADAVLAAFPDGIDVLINNAGIVTPTHPQDTIVDASTADLASLFATNVVGAIAVTQALLPLLRQRGGTGSTRGPCRRLVVNLSSQLASITNCMGGAQGRSGGVACYRISRAANNMAMRTFAAELAVEGFVFLAISPGWVATDMGLSGGRKPPLTTMQSVLGMAAVMATATPAHNGKFFDHDGSELPW